MEYEALIVERSDSTVTVTLNRPEKRNAMNGRMLDEFDHLFTELKMDPDTRFVIFTGAGTAFSGGADLIGLGSGQGNVSPHHSMRLQQMAGHDFIRKLESLEQVTIAAVNGVCLGAGFVVAHGCDFIIASQNARFGIPEANVGLFYTWGCTPRLARIVGPSKAKEMIMTCENVDAEEALRIGLVCKVVPPDMLMTAAHEMVDKISARAPVAVRMAKKIVNASTAANIGDIYVCEPELVERLSYGEDLMEGMRAFAEKRRPRFTGK
ncbi:MAG: enoyl-CoA hydratase/isomerase family protein [Chloroflexota bacterium]|nr:enoyl-CoA hydratase/isomerase family protein [Chloroflexota bacterium]